MASFMPITITIQYLITLNGQPVEDIVQTLTDFDITGGIDALIASHNSNSDADKAAKEAIENALFNLMTKVSDEKLINNKSIQALVYLINSIQSNMMVKGALYILLSIALTSLSAIALCGAGNCLLDKTNIPMYLDNYKQAVTDWMNETPCVSGYIIGCPAREGALASIETYIATMPRTSLVGSTAGFTALVTKGFKSGYRKFFSAVYRFHDKTGKDAVKKLIQSMGIISGDGAGSVTKTRALVNAVNLVKFAKIAESAKAESAKIAEFAGQPNTSGSETEDIELEVLLSESDRFTDYLTANEGDNVDDDDGESMTSQQTTLSQSIPSPSPSPANPVAVAATHQHKEGSAHHDADNEYSMGDDDDDYESQESPRAEERPGAAARRAEEAAAAGGPPTSSSRTISKPGKFMANSKKLGPDSGKSPKRTPIGGRRRTRAPRGTLTSKRRLIKKRKYRTKKIKRRKITSTRRKANRTRRTTYRKN